MEKPLIRPLMPVFILLIAVMVGVDIYIDQLGGHSWMSSLAHIVFGGTVILTAILCSSGLPLPAARRRR